MEIRKQIEDWLLDLLARGLRLFMPLANFLPYLICWDYSLWWLPVLLWKRAYSKAVERVLLSLDRLSLILYDYNWVSSISFLPSDNLTQIFFNQMCSFFLCTIPLFNIWFLMAFENIIISIHLSIGSSKAHMSFR